jgi:hypothetical protein
MITSMTVSSLGKAVTLFTFLRCQRVDMGVESALYGGWSLVGTWRMLGSCLTT